MVQHPQNFFTMNNRRFLILLIIPLISSCAKSIVGTYKVTKPLYGAFLDIRDKQQFYYSEYDDQASREGSGTYEITDGQLILNFGNNEKFITDSSIVKQPVVSDSLVIHIFNVNDKPHRLHYRIDSPIDRHDLDYFTLIEPNESFNIKIPFVENTKIGLYTKNHRKVIYNFSEKGFYEIRHKFIEGPQFDISNTKWTFNVLENNKVKFVLQKSFIKGSPLLEFNKTSKF